MTDGMKITVLFFAQTAEIAGVRSLSLELPTGASAADAWTSLCQRYPGLAKIESGIAIAVNEQIVNPKDQILAPGDTLAVIPPVSGG